MTTYTKLIKPVLTEKSSVLQAKGIYTFFVRKDATKVEIKNEIEKIYGKTVKSVRVQINPKKIRLLGKNKIMTKRSLKKIARVTLKNNDTIDPNKLKDNKKTIKKDNIKTQQ